MVSKFNKNNLLTIKNNLLTITYYKYTTTIEDYLIPLQSPYDYS